MNSKKWVKFFFIVTGIVSIGMISINYIIDPLWLFSHKNQLNQKQSGFNERLQKTNYIYFRGIEKYDGVLIGSSRATYINENNFHGMNIFNYASSNLYPIEFSGYINFLKKQKQSDLKYIILGLDFFGYGEVEELKFEEPEFYINKINTPFYVIKNLLSYDTYKYSKRNLENILGNKESFYDRNNIKYHIKVSEEKRIKQFTKNLKKHLESFEDETFKVNQNYRKILETLKKENRNTKIIVYTSPITAELLTSILKNPKRYEDFKNWLETVVDIFGEINHFMNINSITTNVNNYPDDDHLYPEFVNYIAYKISNVTEKKIPSDFGIMLNKNNLKDFLKDFHKAVIEYNKEKGEI